MVTISQPTLFILGGIVALLSIFLGVFLCRLTMKRNYIRADADVKNVASGFFEAFTRLMVDQAIVDQADTGAPIGLMYNRHPYIDEAGQEKAVAKRKELMAHFGSPEVGYRITIGRIIMLSARFGFEPMLLEIKAAFTNVQRSLVDNLLVGVKTKNRWI